MAGWSIGDAVDLLVKLAPAITIVFGLVAAQVQWRRQQKLNAVLIAKNHYREMLDQLARHSRIIARGETAEGLAEIRGNPADWQRYIMLFATVAFALQEIYFATDPKRNKHWAEVIRLFFGPFRNFMSSDELFTPGMSASVDPEFSTFVRTLMVSTQPGIVPRPLSRESGSSPPAT